MGSIGNIFVWQYHVHLFLDALLIIGFSALVGMPLESISQYITISTVTYIFLLIADVSVHLIFENAPKGIRWSD